MRRLVVALALAALASDASAGEFDLPILRGSSAFVPAAPTYTRWGGFYVGGQLGYGGASVDFSQATRELIAFSLRELALESEQHPSEWQVLGKTNVGGSSYGGFFGYNSQWDSVILGIELNYSRGTFSAVAPNTPIARSTTAGGNTYLVDITGSASMRITDFGTVRGRAGYVMGNLLPYFMVGLAIGRADTTRSATVSGTEDADGVITPFSFTESESKTASFIYGWAVGGGIDVLALPNVFLRGEFEYASFSQASGITAAISTARVGAGLKF